MTTGSGEWGSGGLFEQEENLDIIFPHMSSCEHGAYLVSRDILSSLRGILSSLRGLTNRGVPVALAMGAEGGATSAGT